MVKEMSILWTNTRTDYEIKRESVILRVAHSSLPENAFVLQICNSVASLLGDVLSKQLKTIDIAEFILYNNPTKETTALSPNFGHSRWI